MNRRHDFEVTRCPSFCGAVLKRWNGLNLTLIDLAESKSFEKHFGTTYFYSLILCASGEMFDNKFANKVQNQFDQ